MPDVIGVDHIYISVSNLAMSERFYDIVFLESLAFRKNRFTLNGEEHIQYYNRHFGYVLRPAQGTAIYMHNAPGLHHFCLRVESIAEVRQIANELRAKGIAASEAKNFPEYAPDYWASFFKDPDGLELEVTNYRQERRDRNENW